MFGSQNCQGAKHKSSDRKMEELVLENLTAHKKGKKTQRHSTQPDHHVINVQSVSPMLRELPLSFTVPQS